MYRTDDEKYQNREAQEVMEAEFREAQLVHDSEGHDELVSGCIACEAELEEERIRAELDAEWDAIREELHFAGWGGSNGTH